MHYHADTPFQSQTGSPSSSDGILSNTLYCCLTVSIPNGKPILFRRRVPGTGQARVARFNPKREAHPLQTNSTMPRLAIRVDVSIPNGKPILFRPSIMTTETNDRQVSIPNGKPILFRPGIGSREGASRVGVSIPNGKPILFRPCSVSQTHCRYQPVSIPNGKPILFRRVKGKGKGNGTIVSIPNGKPILFRLSGRDSLHARAAVSIPNGKPILFRQRMRMAIRSPSHCFNPKREAHPLQTLLISPMTTLLPKFQSQTGSPSSSDL